MNLEETDRLLTLIQNVDKRRIDDATVLVWHEILGELAFADCVVAVTTHFRESTDYLMPAHIVRGAREIDRKRIREERARLAIEQAPETDPRPLSDRSAEIREFVEGVRSILPDGNPDALWHGRGHWRRVREGRERQENAEPNPDFDPRVLADLADAATTQEVAE